MKQNISFKKGFTLIEMIVSLGIFTIVALISIGALVRITDANKKSITLKTTINNLNFALIDVMAGSRIPIHTVGLGMIASMGLLMFIAGKKGHRALTPNTLIMSHQWSSFFYGKEHELIAVQKEQKILSDMIMKHYLKYTGMPEKDIRKYLLPAHDVWLTAKEAKKLGICDIIKDI
jgi:prepilin-type N-terminal cleavage/methylation domain-containing protein